MTAVLLPLALAVAPALQGGYTTESFPEQGLTLPRARDYIQMPVPADETWQVIYFAEKQSVGQREKRAKPPVLCVVRIDGASDGAALPSDGDSPISDFDGYLAAFHRGVARSLSRGQRECDGYVGSEHDLISEKGSSGAAWCYVYERATPTPRTFAFVGYGAREDFAKLTPIWREMAGKVRFAEPVAPDPGAWSRLYEKKPLREVERRIELRKRLVRGWDAEDTENFIALVHEPRKPFLKRILADLEGLHDAFGTMLPLPAAEEPLGIVRLCETRDEYLIYGGDPNFTVLFNERIRELVLFDPVKEGDREAEEAALKVFRGQAFAQYWHPRVGDLAHPWFADGHIDYFTGVELAGKVLRVRPGSDLAYVQSRIERDKAVPWSEAFALGRKEFDKRKCFWQSGSLVYFLRQSKEAAGNERWSGILDRYLAALLSTRDARIAAGDEPDAARTAAREAALAAAMEGVDVVELESTWKAFTLRLKAD